MTRITAYILTLESIPERLANAIALQVDLVQYHGLQDTEIVPAIFWAETGAAGNFLAANPRVRFTQKYLAECKQGQLCATLSHIRMWHKLVDGDYTGALVFEDDIFISDPTRFQQVLDEIPQHTELDFLRIHQYKKYRAAIAADPEDALFVEDPSRWGFAAYYLSRQGAEKLLNRFQKIDDNVDLIVPRMAREGQLAIRTVKPVVLDHRPFEGTAEELQQRHAEERTPDKLQREASTIWTSPSLFDDESLHRQISALASTHVQELRDSGFTVLHGVFGEKTIAACRERVQQNLHLFKQTRPSPSARHLAGFHRFPQLEPLHTLLTSNRVLQRFFAYVLDDAATQTLGLSDITVNRSQHWHKDLLRGKFSVCLQDQEMCWGEQGGGVYKILFYLQAGISLKLIRSSHRVAISLLDDRFSEPNERDEVVPIAIQAGDIVIIDIRMTHRGAAEETYLSGQYDDDPRMLISTALGAVGKPLTQAMEVGNFHRLVDWIKRNR